MTIDFIRKCQETYKLEKLTCSLESDMSDVPSEAIICYFNSPKPRRLGTFVFSTSFTTDIIK